MRDGKQRKHAFAKRPARALGSNEWLSRQLSRMQERTLRIAFQLFINDAQRLRFCQELRRTGVQHRKLPLKRSSKCTGIGECRCDPDYLQLVGKDGGMGDGTPGFVRVLPVLPCERAQASRRRSRSR